MSEHLIGYVSDENYIALPEVLLEFVNDRGSISVYSRASGSVYADLEPGSYCVTLYKDGYGSKQVDFAWDASNKPHQFRLLADQLLGYMWPKAVRGGEVSELRMHAAEEVRVELWRYGWEKEFIRGLGVLDEHGPRAVVQITPDGDYTQTGVKWNQTGFLTPARRNPVEAPTRSGLYYIHAKGKSGDFFSFPWIVAPQKPQSKIAVLASNINWTCYNTFGGRSNYIQAAQLRDRPTVNARQDLKRYIDPNMLFYDTKEYAPLSFDRPEPICHIDQLDCITDPIRGRGDCHTAPTEWRFFGWLEREGFDYDLYAETQFHDGTLKLDDYKVLVITTHPEYWSKQMYYELKSWVFERGGKLMYLGGNGLNCEVEFLDDSTITVLNGDKGNDSDETYESRYHRREESEANLLGVVFTFTGAMTSAPYKVIDESHWIFEGTGLKNGDLFGEKSLHVRCPGGASGHETDKISSKHSPKNTHLIAKGTNIDDGGGEIVHFDTPGGGEVFSVGSITYPASIAVDDSISQITANVIRRFTE